MLTAEYDYEMDIAVQREEAMMHGIKQGKLEGIQQGIHKNQTNIVLNMVSKGFDMQTISKCTDLDIAEVQKIRDNSQ